MNAISRSKMAEIIDAWPSVQWRAMQRDGRAATDCAWQDLPPSATAPNFGINEYRIKPQPVKAREWPAAVFGDGSCMTFQTISERDSFITNMRYQPQTKPIRVREVLPPTAEGE